MKLKDPNRYTRWEFYLGESGEYRVPQTGFLLSKNKLVERVIQQMKSLEEQRVYAFYTQLQEEARQKGLEERAYLGLLIEHQICLRAKDAGKVGLCFSGGLGDNIHSAISKVESAVLKNIPQRAKTLYHKVVTAISPSSGGKLSGCTRCSGTRGFSAKQNNLGRAGKLNK